MVGWHHQLNGHEFEQTPGESERQGSLAGCCSWGRKELDMTATYQQPCLFSTSVTLFLFCRWVNLCHFFPDSTYK